MSDAAGVDAAWARLEECAARLRGSRILDLMGEDSRNQRLRAEAPHIHFDGSRQRIDAAALDALLELAESCNVSAALNALQDGAIVNPTEGRAALHTALRAEAGDRATPAFAEAQHHAAAAREQMRDLVAAIHARAAFDDVVHVGIGGSELGPRLASDAMSLRKRLGPRCHFLANVDGHAAARLIRDLDPARTLVVIVSKSFGTEETMRNAGLLMDWMTEAGLARSDALSTRAVAVTAQAERARAFGIPDARILPFADSIGGRYSLWSTVGFSFALEYGMDAFEDLLAGARSMDRHVASTPLAGNGPVLAALIGIWNRNLMRLPTRAVVPYDQRLRELPMFLQQLEMESNGKSVDVEGRRLVRDSVPVVWGGVGSNVQHAWFQALHQGTQEVPVDFIGVIQPDHAFAASHRALLSHMLAQGAALLRGGEGAGAASIAAGGSADTGASDIAPSATPRAASAPGSSTADVDTVDPHRRVPGDHPSNTLLVDRLTPEALGALLAFHEHQTHVQGVLWNINSFDQFGVELGKQLAGIIAPALSSKKSAAKADALDSSTRNLAGRLARAVKTD